MKKLRQHILICLQFLFLITGTAQGQKISNSDLKILRQKEDSLKEFSQYLNTDEYPEDRMYSDSIFTKTLKGHCWSKILSIIHLIRLLAFQNCMLLIPVFASSPGTCFMVPILTSIHNNEVPYK